MRNTQLHLGMSLIHTRTFGVRAIPCIYECIVCIPSVYMYVYAVIKPFDRWNIVCEKYAIKIQATSQ